MTKDFEQYLRHTMHHQTQHLTHTPTPPPNLKQQITTTHTHHKIRTTLYTTTTALTLTTAVFTAANFFGSPQSNQITVRPAAHPHHQTSPETALISPDAADPHSASPAQNAPGQAGSQPLAVETTPGTAPTSGSTNSFQQDRNTGLNVIDIGSTPAVFEAPELGARCLISNRSVYCGLWRFDASTLTQPVSNICSADQHSSPWVTDAALADGKFWFHCTNEDVYYSYKTSKDDTVNDLRSWVNKDQLRQHQRPKHTAPQEQPPILLPNTTLRAGDYSCTRTTTALTCHHEGSDAGFDVFADSFEFRHETASYPLPMDLL